MGREIWNVGAITQSELFLNIKRINERIIHADVAFEIYDSYPGTPWNGGRPTATSARYTFDDFVQGVEMLNRHGIGFNFTFSNLLLEEKHLDDERGNYLLERFHTGQNGVIAGSEVLAKYIRKRFPKYRLINTLTHYHRDPDYYRRARDFYDIFVLPPALNHRLDFIEELGPERVEAAGLEHLEMLWGEDPSALLDEFIGSGFRALVTCVWLRALGRELLGRQVDRSFQRDLAEVEDVDVCGENGEYHTLVYDGPTFLTPLPVQVHGVHEEPDYAFLDVRLG